jgi:hypothetical protein
MTLVTAFNGACLISTVIILLNFSKTVSFIQTLPQIQQLYFACNSEQGKAIPVTGRGGPQGCETLRLPHFLHNRLTDGGEVLSLMHWC